MITHWWLGENTETTAIVVCRSDATATVSVSCNGQTFSGSADSGVLDGVVAITVTGLQAGQKYAYTIDGAAAGTLKAKKSSGDVWIAVGSCWDRLRPDALAFKLMRDYDIDLYLALGDFPYCDTSYRNVFGESTYNTLESVARSKELANYYAHHRQCRYAAGIKELMRNMPFRYMPDDHEYPFNDAAPTWLAQYQADVTGAELATQTDLDEAWAAAKGAIDAYTTGFTRATTADADAVYGRYRIGNIEVFSVDCCNYRSPPPDADTAAKTMLGSTQKAWLIEAVTTSTATFKLISNGKSLFKGGVNPDTWNAQWDNLGYETEKAEIIYALRNVTGVAWVAGDQHMWSDQWLAAGDMGAGYPAVSCLVCCPTTVSLNPFGIEGYETGVRSKVNGYPATPVVERDNVVGLLRVTDNRLYRYLLSTRRGLIPCGYIAAGSNQVQYPQMRFG